MGLGWRLVGGAWLEISGWGLQKQGFMQTTSSQQCLADRQKLFELKSDSSIQHTLFGNSELTIMNKPITLVAVGCGIRVAKQYLMLQNIQVS